MSEDRDWNAQGSVFDDPDNTTFFHGRYKPPRELTSALSGKGLDFLDGFDEAASSTFADEADRKAKARKSKARVKKNASSDDWLIREPKQNQWDYSHTPDAFKAPKKLAEVLSNEFDQGHSSASAQELEARFAALMEQQSEPVRTAPPVKPKAPAKHSKLKIIAVLIALYLLISFVPSCIESCTEDSDDSYPTNSYEYETIIADDEERELAEQFEPQVEKMFSDVTADQLAEELDISFEQSFGKDVLASSKIDTHALAEWMLEDCSIEYNFVYQDDYSSEMTNHDCYGVYYTIEHNSVYSLYESYHDQMRSESSSSAQGANAKLLADLVQSCMDEHERGSCSYFLVIAQKDSDGGWSLLEEAPDYLTTTPIEVFLWT